MTGFEVFVMILFAISFANEIFSISCSRRLMVDGKGMEDLATSASPRDDFAKFSSYIAFRPVFLTKMIIDIPYAILITILTILEPTRYIGVLLIVVSIAFLQILKKSESETAIKMHKIDALICIILLLYAMVIFVSGITL